MEHNYIHNVHKRSVTSHIIVDKLTADTFHFTSTMYHLYMAVKSLGFFIQQSYITITHTQLVSVAIQLLTSQTINHC